MNLSPEQRAVIDAPLDNDIVLTAPAGCGKTEVLALRIERIVSESDQRVLAVSYTNRAQRELEDRLRLKLGICFEQVDCTTIHGLAYRILRRHYAHVGFGRPPEVLERKAFGSLTQSIAVCDRKSWQKQNCVVSFSSTIEFASQILELGLWQIGERWSALVIDEAQNLTEIQRDFLRRVRRSRSMPLPTLMAGDSKQSIFEFGGANPNHMLGFAKENSTLDLQLSKNYRSDEDIEALANAVRTGTSHDICQSSNVVAGQWDKYRVLDELKIFLGNTQTATVALLLRRNECRDHWREFLEGHGIACEQVVQGEEALKALIRLRAESFPPGYEAQVKCLLDENSLGSALRAACPLGMFETLPPDFTDLPVIQRYWCALRERPESKRSWKDLNEVILTRESEPLTCEGVSVLTYHKAQGRSFDCVVLPELCGFQERDRELLYVGVTRAKSRVILAWQRDPSYFVRSLLNLDVNRQEPKVIRGI